MVTLNIHFYTCFLRTNEYSHFFLSSFLHVHSLSLSFSLTISVSLSRSPSIFPSHLSLPVPVPLLLPRSLLLTPPSFSPLSLSRCVCLIGSHQDYTEQH